MEWWSDGVMERWSGGVVEWWSGGAVERWSGGAVERWSGGAVERWSGGAVERKLFDTLLSWRFAGRPLRQSSWARQVIGGLRVEEVKLILRKGDRHALIQSDRDGRRRGSANKIVSDTDSHDHFGTMVLGAVNRAGNSAVGDQFYVFGTHSNAHLGPRTREFMEPRTSGRLKREFKFFGNDNDPLSIYIGREKINCRRSDKGSDESVGREVINLVGGTDLYQF